MRLFYVVETNKLTGNQTFYTLSIPDVTEKDFYRTVTSLNAFFYHGGKNCYNVTDERQFSIYRENEWNAYGPFKLLNEYLDIDIDILIKPENSNLLLYDFYQKIGFDRKTKTYLTGEAIAIWKNNTFVYKKRRQISQPPATQANS